MIAVVFTVNFVNRVNSVATPLAKAIRDNLGFDKYVAGQTENIEGIFHLLDCPNKPNESPVDPIASLLNALSSKTQRLRSRQL